MAKRIYDMKHVSNVTAWAIMRNGEHAGNVIANWSDNPAGSVCTMNVNMFGHIGGPLNGMNGTGKAGGGGYDKLSAAFDDAIRPWCKELAIELPDLSGRGGAVCVAWLGKHGYAVVQVIG